MFRAQLAASHEELVIPTSVVATDLESGEVVVLSEGDLRRNVLASSAIPGIFPPVRVNGRLLVDGGLAAHVPMVPARTLGARTLVVFDTGFPCGVTKLPRKVTERVIHVMLVMLRSQSLGVVVLLGRSTTILYLPPPCPLDIPAHNFSRGSQLIEGGFESASAFLEEVEVVGPGVYGHPHVHPEATHSKVDKSRSR